MPGRRFKIDNTPSPTAGQGLTLDSGGGLPATLLPIVSYVATPESTASTTAVNLTTIQSITVPRPGTYFVQAGFRATVMSGGGQNIAAIKVGSAAAVIIVYYAGIAAFNTLSGSLVVKANDGDAIVMQFAVNGGAAGTFDMRWMSIQQCVAS